MVKAADVTNKENVSPDAKKGLEGDVDFKQPDVPANSRLSLRKNRSADGSGDASPEKEEKQGKLSKVITPITY